MSICISAGLKISARPFFLPEHSDSKQNRFIFGYEITITNQSLSAVQLLDRHWVVTDGHGQVEHVKGVGVIGQQPRLEAGQSFTYSSFCPLNTPYGFMRGSFGMMNSEGELFEAAIASFALLPPSLLN